MDEAVGLRDRDFITIALPVRPWKPFDDNWIYIYNPDLKVGLMKNLGNWPAAMASEPGMSHHETEYFTSDCEPLSHMTGAGLTAPLQP